MRAYAREWVGWGRDWRVDTLRTPIVLDCWNRFVRTRFDIGGLMVIQQVIRTGRIYVRACVRAIIIVVQCMSE